MPAVHNTVQYNARIWINEQHSKTLPFFCDPCTWSREAHPPFLVFGIAKIQK
jgi:hypothetical protein